MGDVFLGRIELSIEIKAPPEKIWEMLAFDRSTEWMGDMMTFAEYTSEVKTSEDKLKVGATAHAKPTQELDMIWRLRRVSKTRS